MKITVSKCISFSFILLFLAAVPSFAFASVSTITWANNTSPLNQPAAWNAVTWSATLGKFAAVSQTGIIATSPDGATWTTQAYPQGFALFAITWSPDANIFVATGAGGHVMTSSDGITWATQVTGGHLIESVVWSPTATDGVHSAGLFAAVSFNGSQATQVITSHDGLSWDVRNAAANVAWSSVTWSPTAFDGVNTGIFVAVAFSGTVGQQVMTSHDGVNWTSRSSAAANQWQNVTWSPDVNKFVAVAANNSGIMYSSDGVNWSSASAPANNNWASVVWSPTNSKFVSTSITGSAGTRVMYSSDGITWSSASESYSTENNWSSITWSPTLGKFLAVSNSGTLLSTQVMTSTDGLTWTNQTMVGTALSNWYSSTWAPEIGTFVAVSLNDALMTSTDGINWTPRTIPVGLEPRSVAWSPTLGTSGRFVVVLEASTEVLTSDDGGVTWDERTSGGSILSNQWYSVVWSPTASDGSNPAGLFVAVAANNSGVMTSHDGITWTMRTTGVVNNTWKSVVWSPERAIFLAVASTGTTSNQVMTSSDGVTWSSQTINTNNQWFKVVWAASAPNESSGTGEFVAVSFSGTQATQVMTSPTGLSGTWTDHTAAANLQWEDVKWSPELGVFVAVAVNGTASTGLMMSANGISWSSLTVPLNNQWSGITYSPDLGLFLAVGTSGYAMETSVLAAPTISAISSGSPGTTSATITWTTDEQASSQVFYSTDTSYGSSTTLDSSLVFSHSVPLSGLSCGTTYHYKVSSTLLGHNTLSGDNTFSTTTGTCATVTTSPASPLGSTTATLNGTITSIGGSSPTVRGFHWGIDATYGTTTTENGSFSTGAFSANLTGLLPGTTYHYQAYATNLTGTAVSTPDATFTTTTHRNIHKLYTPVVSISSPTDISASTALMHGKVVDEGSSITITRGFYYGTDANYGLTTKEINGLPADIFSAQLSNLTCGTTYHVAAYAMNSAGTDVSDDSTFNTLPCAGGSGGGSAPIDTGTTTTSPQTNSPFVFTHTLKKGTISPDVKVLQKFLNSHAFIVSSSGPGSIGSETTMFGLKTFAALILFQNAHKAEVLVPLGLTKGTGYFGPATLALVNKMLANGN